MCGRNFKNPADRPVKCELTSKVTRRGINIVNFPRRDGFYLESARRIHNAVSGALSPKQQGAITKNSKKLDSEARAEFIE